MLRQAQHERWVGLVLAALMLAGAADAPIDPLTIPQNDFARHRDPAAWRDLTVDRLTFHEERAHWRIYRIVNRERRDGPLWFVPHDNENAGFEAALVALRRYGGTLIAVDSDDARMNDRVDFGRPIDPNRNFHDGLPRYARVVLEAVTPDWPIVALHTNSPGYDPRDSRCPHLGNTSGDGIISVRYCDDVLTPSASRSQVYPFDDDDTVAFATYPASKGVGGAWCRDAMVAADWNVVQERVANTDGSLSNYAVLRGIPYLNFETRETGLQPDKLAAARDRLVWMIDRAMAMCPVPNPRSP